MITQILAAITFVIFLFTCIVIYKRWSDRIQKEFERQFPPISDAEFMARCTPGSYSRTALKVRKVVADNLGVEYARIYPSTRFMEDLGAD